MSSMISNPQYVPLQAFYNNRPETRMVTWGGSQKTPILDTNCRTRVPKDWKARLINVSSPGTNGVTGLCLDPHDLFISKIAAWRDKDLDFVRAMIGHGMVDQDRLLALATKVPNPEDDLGRAARITARIERLYADRDRLP